MAVEIKAVKGTRDILPGEIHKYRLMERTALNVAEKFGFQEIRTPVFERTELFQRGVGETTDVVQKEMYVFDDKGGRAVALRPEGTAGVARAFLERGLFNETLPQKLCYIINCYRYEKPQAGRWREFQQFGAEILGTDSPAADAEIISLANEIFTLLGADSLRLEINSIGCPECRQKYRDALKKYFEKKKDEICPTCLARLEKNPMRILDCKNPVCAAAAKDAPVILDYICGDCAAHFARVRGYLDVLNMEYHINPRIVRGLDYYTRTVFEFVSDEIGAQGAVCGGGRYDGLIELLGGPKVPALGFAVGTGRLLAALEARGVEFPAPKPCAMYIAPIGESASREAAALVADLRAFGISAQTDLVGRSLKAQMKHADKIGAKYVMALGEDELENESAQIKRMSDGKLWRVDLEDFTEDFIKILARDDPEASGSPARGGSEEAAPFGIFERD